MGRPELRATNSTGLASGNTASKDSSGTRPPSLHQEAGQKKSTVSAKHMPSAQTWHFPGSLADLLPGKPGATGTPGLAKSESWA